MMFYQTIRNVRLMINMALPLLDKELLRAEQEIRSKMLVFLLKDLVVSTTCLIPSLAEEEAEEPNPMAHKKEMIRYIALKSASWMPLTVRILMCL